MVQHKPPGTFVNLETETILKIIERATEVVKAQPMLLKVEAPVTIGTDIHG